MRLGGGEELIHGAIYSSAGTSSGKVYVLELNGEVRNRLEGLEAEVTSLHYDGTHVAVAGVNGEVWVFSEVRSLRAAREAHPGARSVVTLRLLPLTSSSTTRELEFKSTTVYQRGRGSR